MELVAQYALSSVRSDGRPKARACGIVKSTVHARSISFETRGYVQKNIGVLGASESM